MSLDLLRSGFDMGAYPSCLVSAGSRSSSPGKLFGQSSYGRVPRAAASSSSTAADKRSRIPRSQGCSRETSPSRAGQGKTQAAGQRSARS